MAEFSHDIENDDNGEIVEEDMEKKINEMSNNNNNNIYCARYAEKKNRIQD